MEKEQVRQRRYPTVPTQVEGFYHELKNEIVQPHRVVLIERYFLDKWAPVLGPTLSMIIIKLRSMCYRNLGTGETRNYCFPSRDTLANSIGVSRATIERELNPKDPNKKEVLELFVKKTARYRYDPKHCRKVRTSNLYLIALDNPLTPEDQQKVKEMAEEKAREMEEQKERASLKAQVLPTLPSTAQIEPQEYGSNCAVERRLKMSQEEVLGRTTLNQNVNVTNALKNPQKEKPKIKREGIEREMEIEQVAQEAAERMGDKKSLGFYRKAARLCHPQLIYALLSEAKMLYNEGRIQKSMGATFTDMFKRWSAGALTGYNE